MTNDKAVVDEQKPRFDHELVVNGLTDNQTGFREISSNIQRKLDAMDTDLRVHFLEEVYDDAFIYRVVNRETREDLFYKRGYDVQNDGSIEFQGDPVQVRKNVTYEEVNTNKMKRTKFPNTNNNMSKTKENCAPCAEKIAALIANEATQFTEEDRDFLESLEESRLDRLVPVAAKPAENKKPAQEKKNEDPAKNEDRPEGIEKSVEQQIREMVKNSQNAEEYIDKVFPPELAEQYKAGLKLHREKRNVLIKAITENSEFTEDEIKDFPTERLEKLSKAVVREQADYSLNGGGPAVNRETIGDQAKEDMLYVMNAYNTPPKEQEEAKK